MSLPNPVTRPEYFERKLTEKATALKAKWDAAIKETADPEQYTWFNTRVLRQITEIPLTHLNSASENPQLNAQALIVGGLEELKDNTLPSATRQFKDGNKSHVIDALERDTANLINDVLSAFGGKSRA